MPHYLLTFLGTGPEDKHGNKLRSYRQANYRLPDGQMYESSFVARALWSTGEYDGIILVGTMASMWEEAYQAFAEEPDDATATKLYEVAAAASEDSSISSSWLQPVSDVLPGSSRIVVLEYGYSADSAVRNVNHLADALQVLPKGAQLTLDITHGFRSQPFVALAALQATSIRLDAPYRLRHIRYGMLELASKRGHAEVVSLDAVLQLEQVGRAAYIAQAYGRFVELYEALPRDHALRSPLKALDEALALFRLQPATEALERVRKVLAGDLDPVSEPVRWVIHALLQGLRQNPSAAQIQFAFARWFNRQRNYGAAVIYLVEAMVTLQCEQLKLDTANFDARERARQRLRGEDKKPFGRRYIRLVDIRNAVAHASIDTRRQPDNDIAYLNESIGAIEQDFK